MQLYITQVSLNYKLVSLFLADLHLVTICLLVCSRPLVVAGYYYHHCLYDNQGWLCTRVEGGGGLIKVGKLAKMSDCFRLFSLCVYLVSEV